MRFWRMTLLGCALAIALPSMIQAQQEDAGRTRLSGRRVVHMLLKDIQLDSAQSAKVDATMAKYRTQMQGLRKDDGSRDAAARERMFQLIERQKAEIRALLTPKQQAIYDRNSTEVTALLQERKTADRNRSRSRDQ